LLSHIQPINLLDFIIIDPLHQADKG
jgi:hypothetical protein